MSQTASGFTRALAALWEAGVEFVVVGVGGVNFYARTPGEVFATVDLDALLRPAAGNLAVALQVLSGIGYTFECVANSTMARPRCPGSGPNSKCAAAGDERASYALTLSA